MNGLSLFTGSGIGELAFKQIIPNYQTVCYVEWDKYCQKLIQARIKDGILNDAPIWDDVQTFNGKEWAGKVDFISGGFPCQPFSVAGKGKAEQDERNMWPDTFRIISEIQPQYAFLENVPNLLTHKYIRRIFADLAKIGYDCEWDIVSAAFVGARHLRKRVWILADSNGTRGVRGAGNEADRCSGTINGNQPQTLQTNNKGKNKIFPNTHNQRLEGQCKITSRIKTQLNNISNEGWWSVEPKLGRVADGVALRVERIATIGNGWVPQVVRRILEVNNI